MELVPGGAARLVLITAPPGEAHVLARRLVEAGHAACVNVVPGLRSVYRWQGAIHDDPESLLVAKTTSEHLPALMSALDEQHPYEIPEAIVLAPESGSAPYLAWLAQALAPPRDPAHGP